MKFLNRTMWLLIANLFICSQLHAEAIAEKDIGYFQLPEYSMLVVPAPKATPSPPAVTAPKPDTPTTVKPPVVPKPNTAAPIQPPAALLVKMPPKLTESIVVPANAPAKTNAGKNPPAGTLPISIDPKTGKVVLLLGYEVGNITGFTDFGGSGDPTDNSRGHTAVREFNEEACLAFWEDLTPKKIDRNAMSKSQLESAAKEDLSQNLYPWYYTPRNKYYTCLLPVSYQSISDLTKKMQIVRSKVNAAPFHEKSDLAWVRMEDFIGWIKIGNKSPSIPGGKGKPISWRFFGLSLDDFTQNTPQWVRDRTIKYLEDIIALNS